MDGLVGHTNRRGVGRPRFGQGQARSAVVKARVKPWAREAFRAEARRRGMTEADALRQALGDWMTKRR